MVPLRTTPSCPKRLVNNRRTSHPRRGLEVIAREIVHRAYEGLEGLCTLLHRILVPPDVNKDGAVGARVRIRELQCPGGELAGMELGLEGVLEAIRQATLPGFQPTSLTRGQSNKL